MRAVECAFLDFAPTEQPEDSVACAWAARCCPLSGPVAQRASSFCAATKTVDLRVWGATFRISGGSWDLPPRPANAEIARQREGRPHTHPPAQAWNSFVFFRCFCPPEGTKGRALSMTCVLGGSSRQRASVAAVPHPFSMREALGSWGASLPTACSKARGPNPGPCHLGASAGQQQLTHSVTAHVILCLARALG